MAARIVKLALRSNAQPMPAPIALGLPDQVPARRHVWRGASGLGYVHAVYSLIECPPLPKATYILARREADGRRRVLHIGLAQDAAATLNLAGVRQRGAQLGANEVHVCFGAASDHDRALVATDLRAGQFRALASEPQHVAA